MYLASLRPLAICAILVTSPLWLNAAGWTTNAWPSYEAPRLGYQQSEDVFAALSERGYNVTESAPYRTQRDRLVAVKEFLDSSISSWGKVTNTATISDDLNAGSGTIDKWTVTGLCAYVSIPTNYFEYTPQSGLAGAGGLVYDTTVGHPHGTTNEYTVDGGSGYPAGRTNWYTTDYGWQGLRDMMPELKYEQLRDIDLWWGTGTLYRTEAFPGPLATNTWEGALELAVTITETNEVSNLSVPFIRTKGSLTIIPFQPDAYRADFQTYLLPLEATDFRTGTVSRVHGFVYSITNASVRVFDAYSSGVVLTNWATLGASAWETNVTRQSVWYGSTNIPSPWADEPVETNKFTERGHLVTDETIVMEYDFDYD